MKKIFFATPLESICLDKNNNGYSFNNNAGIGFPLSIEIKESKIAFETLKKYLNFNLLFIFRTKGKELYSIGIPFDSNGTVFGSHVKPNQFCLH